jgi:hypothetical protein
VDFVNNKKPETLKLVTPGKIHGHILTSTGLAIKTYCFQFLQKTIHFLDPFAQRYYLDILNK